MSEKPVSEKPVLAFLRSAKLLALGYEMTPWGFALKRLSVSEWEAECSAWMARTQSERERSKVAELTRVPKASY